MKSVEREVQIEFFDLDQMGIVWNGRYFDFFEIARHALFIECRVSYEEMVSRGYMTPIVRNKAKYIRPLRLGQVVIVRATIVEYELFLKVRFEIFDKKTGVLTTTGESIQMVTDLEGVNAGCVPDFLRNAIKEHLDV